MTETMTTSEVLNRAADLIEERGWGQGWRAMYGEGGVCVMGAIIGASRGRIANGDARDVDTYDFVEACPAGQALAEYLQTNELWRWNDIQCDGASEVIGALRACAVIEASRERETAPEPVSS